MLVRNKDVHVRVNEAEKRTMVDEWGIEVSRVFRTGFITIKMWIQGEASLSCPYIHITGKNRSHPSGAVSTHPQPPAQACPCPACPIRCMFPDRAAAVNDAKETCNAAE